MTQMHKNLVIQTPSYVMINAVSALCRSSGAIKRSRIMAALPTRVLTEQAMVYILVIRTTEERWMPDEQCTKLYYSSTDRADERYLDFPCFKSRDFQWPLKNMARRLITVSLRSLALS